jgi:hypothetical protein
MVVPKKKLEIESGETKICNIYIYVGITKRTDFELM